MTTLPPVGRREDQRLEFKDAVTLRDPHLIGREVVAMLNAEGGDVWIGVPEEDGVAQAAQDIPTPASSADRLREHLLDTIAPRPGTREVSIEVVTHAAGQCLRIHIEPMTQSQPYAQLRKGGQFFWRRIEALIRPMTLAEVSARLRGTPAQPDPIAEMQRVLSQRGFRGLWIAIVPGREVNLGTDRARIEGLLREPTDVRYPGWNLASSWSEVEPLQGDRGGWLVRQGEAIHLRILRHGIFELTATSTALEHGRHDVVDPRALIALTQSFLRLAGRLNLGLPADDTLNLSIGLFGVDQLELRPFSHDTHGHQREYPGHPHRRYALSRDLLLSTPLEFTVSDLIERPDACAYRLLVRLYQAYGYEMNELPRELDAANGVIRL